MDVPSDLLGEKLHLVAGVDGDYVLFDRKGEQLLAGKVGTLATGAGMTMQVSEMRAHPGMRFQVTRLEERSVVNRLQKAVVVTEAGKNSGILRLAYEGVEPELVRTVLQQVASAYVSQNVERGSAEASAQLKFVREQLPVVRVQVETAQAALSDYQTRANSVDLALQTKGLLDQEVAIEAALQQLQLQRAEMEGKFTRDHPAYRTLLRQVGDLEERRRGFAGQVRRLPEAQQELLRLTRDLKVANEMYTAMLNQVQQLDVARAGSVGNVRIVDAAEVDKSTPVAPRRLLIVAIGMMTGLFLSIGLVLLRKLMSRGIEDPAQIEALGMSVYAAIPLSVQQQSELSIQPSGVVEAKLLALINPADLAVEAIRSLRTSLHFARLESKNNVVVISGATPGAGKTFVSSNLAGVVAQAGQRVLIIDADMRKGVLHKIFGTKQGPGLSELLAGSAVLERVVHTVPGLETLSFISRGAIPPNPSELLMHRNFTDLLTEVGERFDLIIIDTPPILAVTDAAIVGSHAGICLLVARCGLNQRRELESARNRFEQNKVQLKGVVFNAVKRKATDSYGYGYYEYSSTAS